MPKPKGQPAPQPWSESEVESLIQLIGQCMPEHDLCDLLGRTPEETALKTKELTVSQPPPDHPGHTARLLEGERLWHDAGNQDD